VFEPPAGAIKVDMIKNSPEAHPHAGKAPESLTAPKQKS